MYKNKRFTYVILILITIVLGILSRKTNEIPYFIGDILYAVMVYFGMRFTFIHKEHKMALLLALLFCFAIEIQQLYRAEWILKIRNTPLGHYALGEGFLWSDMVCYTIGVLVALIVDSYFVKLNSKTYFK